MGCYNSQYEDYYNGLKKKVKYSPKYNNGPIDLKRTKHMTNWIVKRVIRDLAGVLVLTIFVFSCKIIRTPQTQTAYSYAREVVDKTYDYKTVMGYLKNIDLEKLKTQGQNIINRLDINIQQ